ncbi:unnamed protein product [Durusdinium trenchii]
MSHLGHLGATRCCSPSSRHRPESIVASVPVIGGHARSELQRAEVVGKEEPRLESHEPAPEPPTLSAPFRSSTPWAPTWSPEPIQGCAWVEGQPVFRFQPPSSLLHQPVLLPVHQPGLRWPPRSPTYHRP